MPDLKRNNKVKVPSCDLHHDGDDFIVEIGQPFADVVRCKPVSVSGGAPIGWAIADSARILFRVDEAPRFFWPCSSPYNFAHYLSLRAVRKNMSVAHWKHGFIANMLASKMARMIRPTVAKMDARAVEVCGSIARHITFYDWKMRCHDSGCAMAVVAHIDHGIPLRPALILSTAMGVVDGRPAWKLARGCAEDHPLPALEYQYGDAAGAIYDSLIRSRKQLNAVDIGAGMINDWQFAFCPPGQSNAEAMAFAFVAGMHVCKCCIGSDSRLFCKRVNELMQAQPRKGRRSKMRHTDVCIGNCSARNCEKVEDEPIL